MGQVVHLHQGTRLEEIESEVYRTVDHMCLRLGELLNEARSLDPARFGAWVEERMPFGIDKAKRLIAIHLAYRELPEDVVHNLPRPWQAMFALRKHVPKLEEAIASGEIGPNTTIDQARTKAREWSKDSRDGDSVTARYQAADLAAGKLMGSDPNDLNADVFRALSRWMTRRTPD